MSRDYKPPVLGKMGGVEDVRRMFSEVLEALEVLEDVSTDSTSTPPPTHDDDGRFSTLTGCNLR